MPSLKQYWPALRSALEGVVSEISGSSWKALDLTSRESSTALEDTRAISLKVLKLPEMGAMILTFSSEVATALAVLMAGEAVPKMEDTVLELMRQVSGRMEDTLRAEMKLEECSIALRWQDCAPAAEVAFELRTEGQGPMQFGVGFDSPAVPEEDWSAFQDVAIDVRLRFGSRELALAEILEFSPGDVIELQQRLEEPADLLVGERVFARGEVVLIDGNYGLRVTELVARSIA